MFTRSFGRSVLINCDSNENPLAASIVRSAMLSPSVYAPYNLASVSQPMIPKAPVESKAAVSLSILGSLMRKRLSNYGLLGQLFRR